MGAAEPARDQQRLERQSLLERVGVGGADARVVQRSEAQQEIALVEQSEHLETLRLRGRPDRRQVHVGRDVPLARMAQPRGAVRLMRVVTHRPDEMAVEGGQRTCAVTLRVELLRRVTVVDQDDKAALEPPCGRAHPLDRRQVYLTAPAGGEVHVESREIVGERRARGWSGAFDQAVPGKVDVDLPQAVGGHRDSVRG